MSAGITIFNRQAVAIAMDSAVTTSTASREKIFTSAHKLFSLSHYHPVGILIYGTAKFMGVPWETIIKMYRTRLGKKEFDTLPEYGADFLNYIRSNKKFFPEEVQKNHLEYYIRGYFGIILIEIKEAIQREIAAQKEVSEARTLEIAREIVKTHHKQWDKTETAADLPHKFSEKLYSKYGKTVEALRVEIFEALASDPVISRQLRAIAVGLFYKYPTGIRITDYSGIVIMGFGKDDIFPRSVEYLVDYLVANLLKYRRGGDIEISRNFDVCLGTYAQNDAASSFIGGIHPHYRVEIERLLKELFTKLPQVLADSYQNLDQDGAEKLKTQFQTVLQSELNGALERLVKFQQQSFIDPLLKVVAFLPKSDLATLAETLVSLTSFRKRVSIDEAETVGGPIDVAVISKGDGFVWIKRKHYFESTLNPQFLSAHYREENHDTKSPRTQK